MEATDAGLHLLRASETEAGPWDAAAKYRELLQQQHLLARERLEDDNISSDAASGGQSPRGGSDGTADEVPDDSSDRDAILPLKHKGMVDSEFRIRSDLHSPAAALAALHRHPFSPQSLLAASMRHNPPSMVAQPGLDFRAFNRDSSPASPTASAPAQEPASPPSSSAGHSPRQSSQTHTPWNYEEQFKQLYEIDDNPKRKEFLDELFQFMQNRGTPINRLPIMAKQVLDLYELFNLVVARGGLVEVINKKLWQEIIKGLKLPSSITSAAFTLRTQYMKYLYPQECNKINLSSPSELQAAIDGNRREGRRSNYSNSNNNNPYADLVSSSPFLACHMTPTFGMSNGLSTSLHQPAMTPLSLATSRAGMNGVLGQPVPPSSPFLPAMGAPMIPSANDTLMTLWNMYNKQQQTIPVTPPQMRLDGIGMAQQNEALNLGVRREISRQQPEKERERDWERSASSARELQQREREVKRDHDEESSVERHHESAENLKTKRPRSSPAEESNKVDAMPHTKMKINSKDDGSLVVSMEIRGNMYQGVLFAQPRSGRV